MSKLPLGKKENQSLEFKGRDSLGRLDRIAREVVAMLNSLSIEEGEIWIGLREENGFAVEAEPIPNLDLERRRLWDHLVDTIEPSPTNEVVIDGIEGEGALRLTVRSGKKRPYAQLKAGGCRCFFIRVQDRIRPMSREEVFSDAEADSTDVAISQILDERTELQRKVASPSFALWIRPVPPGELPVETAELDPYLTDYERSNNRPAGFNFIFSTVRPRPAKDKLVLDLPSWGKTEIRIDGSLFFQAPLQWFEHMEKAEIHPYALLELPISFFRLASVLYTEYLSDWSSSVADMAFLQVRGWRLLPGSPRDPFHRFEADKARRYDDEDLVWERPLRFTAEQVRGSPDLCGFRLVRRVYLAFGYFEDAIPREFDRQSGRLLLD